tara:strand:+ start:25 stop:1092 length:1068 start_codon:yes stop_codon:yes gene_type:complete
MQFDHIYDFQVFVLSMDDPRFIAKVIKQSKTGKVAVVMCNEQATIGWAEHWIPKAMCHNENIVWIHSCYADGYYDSLRESKGINFKAYPKGLELIPVVYFTKSHLDHQKGSAQKLFAFMNNKPRYHRAELIDNLYRSGLFDHGHITWRTDINKLVTNYTEDEDYTINRHVFYPLQNYNCKYWEPRTMLWPNEQQRWKGEFLVDDNTGYPDQTIPQEVHESFLILQAETDMNIPNLSEKTYKCLHWKKPFIIVGPRGLHSYLETQGYKLPKIINYDFDNEPDSGTRIKMVIQELTRLSKLNLQKLNEEVQDVVEHNYCVFMDNLKACDDRIKFSEIYQSTHPNHIQQAMVQNITYE